MLAKRLGETPEIRYRTDRFYRINSSWFFSTREGIEMGPYLSRKDAENALKDIFVINEWTKSTAEEQPQA